MVSCSFLLSHSVFSSPLPSSSLFPHSSLHQFISLPLRCRRLRPLFLSLSDNDRIQQLLFRSDDAICDHLPAVRTYESDLCLLSITGTVGHDLAVTAAASDGGVAAEEHLSSGAEAMVVETVFPGRSSDRHSAVSTKLFLPTKKVNEKARNLRKSEILKKTKNILPKTFSQVVFKQLWTFNLRILSPEIKRDIGNLALSREGKAQFTINSADEKLLSSLSEAICSFIIDHTKTTRDKHSSIPTRICSLDSSICVHTISQEEMMDHFANMAINDKKLLVSYRIQIMNNVVNNETKLEGWNELSNNRFEALLTHLQMMDLANVLDMYCEDKYTLSEKKLSIPILEPTKLTKNNNSLFKVLFATFAGCVVIGLIGIAAQIFPRAKLYSDTNLNNINQFETHSSIIHSPDSIEVENYCISVVNRIKEAFGWSGEIVSDSNFATWIGTVPSYLQSKESFSNDDLGIQNNEEFVNKNSNLENNGSDVTGISQQIASFQVVISEEGKIIGFQPTSRVGVNIWASHPLTKDLYKGRNLYPGLWEPILKIPRPKQIVVLELLMSINPESYFAFARPIKDPF